MTLELALQSLELLSPAVRRSYGLGGCDGVWDWEILKPEIPWMGFVLKARPFTALLALRLMAAVALPFSTSSAISAIICIFLALSTALVCLRWRGTYNGGSDYMTLLILLALSLAFSATTHRFAASAALGYIAVQSTLSYFVAGVAKIRHREWRSGEALAQLLGSSLYGLPQLARDASAHRGFCRVAAWAVLLFECGFPFVLLGQWFCLALLAVGLLFHLANVYALGLNRFFWAWLASYPAILYVASRAAR
jgi:hypothetical protein